MRDIKFRGKDIETGEWLYGNVINRIGYMPSIMYPYENEGKVRYAECAVKRDTVGQFTGLYDKDGKEIYEGDILRRKDSGSLLTVEFRHGAFGYEYCGEFHSWAGNHNFTFNPFDTDVDFAIIGNIHDNPELLKQK